MVKLSWRRDRAFTAETRNPCGRGPGLLLFLEGCGGYLGVTELSLQSLLYTRSLGASPAPRAHPPLPIPLPKAPGKPTEGP